MGVGPGGASLGLLFCFLPHLVEFRLFLALCWGLLPKILTMELGAQVSQGCVQSCPMNQTPPVCFSWPLGISEPCRQPVSVSDTPWTPYQVGLSRCLAGLYPLCYRAMDQETWQQ